MHRPTGLETANEPFVDRQWLVASLCISISPHCGVAGCRPHYAQYFVLLSFVVYVPYQSINPDQILYRSVIGMSYRYDMIREYLAVKTLVIFTVLLVPSTDKICTLARCLID